MEFAINQWEKKGILHCWLEFLLFLSSKYETEP